MPPDKKEPQSFAHVLAEAAVGLLAAQISRAWQELNDTLDADSMLHDTVVKGEFTIKLKISNDHGKIAIAPTVTAKAPPKQYTNARFYRSEEGDLTTKDPRTARDMFSERRAEKKAAEPTTKSADAPKLAAV